MDDKEIRFIDRQQNEFFRIKDGEQITITKKDGKTKNCMCCYVDDKHARIAGNVYNIALFIERMKENGSKIRPKDAPSYTLEKIDQSEFEFTFINPKEEKNRGCICYQYGWFGNSTDPLARIMEGNEQCENNGKYKTADFTREMINIINYFENQSDTPILRSRLDMIKVADDINAEIYGLDRFTTGYRITTKENTYYLRCCARRKECNLYMFCYNTKLLNKYQHTRLIENSIGKNAKKIKRRLNDNG